MFVSQTVNKKWRTLLDFWWRAKMKASLKRWSERRFLHFNWKWIVQFRIGRWFWNTFLWQPYIDWRPSYRKLKSQLHYIADLPRWGSLWRRAKFQILSRVRGSDLRISISKYRKDVVEYYSYPNSRTSFKKCWSNNVYLSQ